MPSIIIALVGGLKGKQPAQWMKRSGYVQNMAKKIDLLFFDNNIFNLIFKLVTIKT
jgi:hypothetical protein